ncbi:MAG: reverse transcriptase family protein [Oscillospiraceae bacterium]
MLESLISTELLTYLHTHNLISKNQHGFLKRHSTCTNLLESLNDWTISLSNHRSVLIAYIDFARAFDSISYPKLFIKLDGYGINGNLLFWIKAFLFSRTQSVRVGSHLSSICSVSSGVPQGSVLGPILFLLFINDVADNFHNNVSSKLFADDIKLYTELTSPSSVTNFQNHLDLIESWATIWQIGISHSKCSILELGSTPSHSSFSITNNCIQSSKLVKDLGVYVDSKLTFSDHIHDIVSRAKQRLSLIYRCFLSRDTTNFRRAYTVYIRPILEYASPIWSPSLVYLINEVESVQRYFTRRLPGLGNLSYAERLSIIKLKSLEHRRLIADLIIVFNIVHGLSSLELDYFFDVSNKKNLRGHQFHFTIPLVKLNLRRFFFSHRVLNVWNSLPSDIVSAGNTAQFKRAINRYDFSKFLVFPCVLC